MAKTETEDKTVIRPDTSKYSRARAFSGGMSMNNGDVVATALIGMSVDEIKQVADGMGFEDIDRYDHLNVGQRRMNLGNRIRGLVSATDKAIEQAEALISKADDDGEDVDKDKLKEARRIAKGPSGEALLEKVVKPIRREVDKRMDEAEDARAARAAKAEEAKAKSNKKAPVKKAGGRKKAA